MSAWARLASLCALISTSVSLASSSQYLTTPSFVQENIRLREGGRGGEGRLRKRAKRGESEAG